MIYALIITVIAGLALLSVPTAVFLAGRRLTKPSLAVSGWRFRPNAIGFTVLAIVAAFVLFRIFPEVLFLPLIVPLFWRFRGGRRSGTGGPFQWQWRARHDPPPTNGHSNGHKTGDENPIEGQFRNLDNE